MKRIAGAIAMLLAGVCGCISFAPQGADAKKTEGKVVPAKSTSPAGAGLPPATATAAAQVPHPAEPKWDIPPEYIMNQLRQQQPAPKPAPVEHTAARQNTVPPLRQVPMQAQPPINPNRAAVRAPLPAEKDIPPGMPFAATPKAEPKLEAPSPVQPAAFTQTDIVREPVASVTPAPKPEVVLTQPAPKAPVPVPPTPTAKSAEPRPAGATVRAGGPLFRLINTKRITLNFEVKEVGASGVSAVELWYTQDSKEWKKYDAPTNSKAYVVEVEEEGMYGFTLIARSGVGLGKEPPQAGDSPQVWVIVDLTSPDIKLSDVVPSPKSGQQQVSLKWKASDKNLGRQPITLCYAEKEEGPWKVIAAGLENNGQYTWDVPAKTPGQVFFRVEASDLAGNVGRCQSPKAVLMDNKKPEVSIVGVEANSQ